MKSPLAIGCHADKTVMWIVRADVLMDMRRHKRAMPVDFELSDYFVANPSG